MHHLDDDQLIARVYGVSGADGDTHLASCESCGDRWDRMESARKAAVSAVDATADDLAAQRRNIYARLDERGAARSGWVPAGAAALVAAAGFFFYHPAASYRPAPAAAVHAVADDDQLFAEVYSVQQSSEPRAAEPIAGLFEPFQGAPEEDQ